MMAQGDMPDGDAIATPSEQTESITPPIVSVLIVTYNSETVIADCVKALIDSARDSNSIEIIIVDNGSTDRSVEVAQSANPSVQIIRNKVNLGFAGAVRLAASGASGRFLLLLNPDATITSSAVMKLAETLHRDESVGVIAPLVSQDGGRLATLGAGRRPTTFRMFLHATGLSRLGARFRVLEGHYLFLGSVGNKTREVDWVTGGCLMTRRSVWDALGGLSTRWFMYAEDIDYCLRVGQSGSRVILTPDVSAQHAVGGSSTNVDGRVNTAWIENLFDLYCTTIATNRLQPWLWKLAVVSGFTARRTVYALRASKSSDARMEANRFALYAKALWNSRSTFPTRLRP
jgi:N-acetylglucosaminyl-diphospho-decaprenol L-rhamnosyltransferase